MSYVPTLCVDCWHVHLVSLADAQLGAITCESCGASARVVPGCSYGATEREAFEELASIVAEGHVVPMEARGYAVELERALWSGTHGPLLETLSKRLPGLLPLQVAAGRNSIAQRRVLTKLKTILDAVATARRESAEYPILTVPDVPRVGRR